ALAAGLLLLFAACNSDTAGLSSESPLAADSALAASDSMLPVDSALVASDSVPGEPSSTGEAGGTILEATSQFPGITHATYGLDTPLLSSVQTGTLRGGGVTESSIGSLLSGIRAKGGRVILKLCNGKDSYVKNSDGTFSFTKWKSLVSRFKNSNLGPYIADGTIIGHFLIDEPQRAAKWGGKIIPPSTLEAMGQYSKQLWPGMTTFVRAEPVWLESTSTTFRYVDAGWAQYASGKGDPGSWIAAQVAAAKRKGLGLAVGLNVLDGGNGSSRIAGWSKGKYAMSATEIRTYGGAMLNQSYSCAYYNWMYDATYYGRSDIKSAMADMATKAKAHVRTACNQ
ncbi:MAG: hypothetical protein ABIY46_19865, partial [Gemmatimonadales bacterium]